MIDLNLAELQFVYEALVDKVTALASQQAASIAEAEVWHGIDDECWQIANTRATDQQVQVDILQNIAARMKAEQMYADNPA